jgi:hypothetical protein
MPRPFPTAAALALALLVLPACGGEADAPDAAAPEGTESADATAPAPEAAPTASSGGCTRLSAEEASEIIGLPMAGATGNAADCELTTPSGEVNASYSVTPSTVAYDALAQGGEAVEGLGEEAYWSPVMNMGGNLLVKQDGKMLQVVAMSLSDAHDPRAHAEAMARVLIPRM